MLLTNKTRIANVSAIFECHEDGKLIFNADHRATSFVRSERFLFNFRADRFVVTFAQYPFDIPRCSMKGETLFLVALCTCRIYVSCHFHHNAAAPRVSSRHYFSSLILPSSFFSLSVERIRYLQSQIFLSCLL